MTNETVGDAYSDMLIVETVLCERGWSLTDWYSTYSDLPNRLTKVTVKVIHLDSFVENKNLIVQYLIVRIRIEIHLRLAMLKGFVPNHLAFKT